MELSGGDNGLIRNKKAEVQMRILELKDKA